MYVCMYVCMYVYIYIYMYLYSLSQTPSALPSLPNLSLCPSLCLALPSPSLPCPVSHLPFSFLLREVAGLDLK